MKNIRIAEHTIDSYKIVCNESRGAAEELQKYLALASGVTLPIIGEKEEWTKEIRVGVTNRDTSAELYNDLKNEGFAITVRDGNLTIRGKSERGHFNGVYDFLEHFIGWRFVAKDDEFCKDGDAELDEGLCYKYSPVFEYRQLDWLASKDEAWQRKNGENSKDFPWLGFVHTLGRLAEMTPPYTVQPCLTDPEVLKTVIKNVRKGLENSPDAKIVSVSQEDNVKPCMCDRCRAVLEEEGAQSGAILRFVNAVADDIREDYPDVAIETLAYQYSRGIPRITKPRENVIVRLCSIECCLSHPIFDGNCERNVDFRQDFHDWGKICNRIYIWDYVTDFPHYLTPFPNLRVFRANMRFFADNHVVGIYPCGNYEADESGEFGEMRAYLLGRLMWNPRMSEEEYYGYMADFLDGYYGRESAVYIRRFIDFTLRETADRHFWCFEPPFGVIPREVYESHFNEIESWWDDAEKAAGEKLARVQRSRHQWTYIKLCMNPDENAGRAFYNASKKDNVFIKEGQIPYAKLAEPDFTQPPSEWDLSVLKTDFLK